MGTFWVAPHLTAALMAFPGSEGTVPGGGWNAAIWSPCEDSPPIGLLVF